MALGYFHLRGDNMVTSAPSSSVFIDDFLSISNGVFSSFCAIRAPTRQVKKSQGHLEKKLMVYNLRSPRKGKLSVANCAVGQLDG